MNKSQVIDAVKSEIRNRAELMGFFVKEEDLSAIEEGGYLWVMARTVYHKWAFVYKIRCSVCECVYAVNDYEILESIGNTVVSRCKNCNGLTRSWWSCEYHPYGLCDILGNPYPRENKPERVVFIELRPYSNHTFRLDDESEVAFSAPEPRICIPIPSLVFRLPLRPPYGPIDQYAADYRKTEGRVN